MSDTVFILGAGASKPGGAPLVNSFLDEARRLYTQPPPLHLSDSSAFELVFKAISQLQVAHSKSALDLYNLEAVFGAFEMAKLFGSPIGALSSDDIGKLDDAMKVVIVRTLSETLRFPVQTNIVSSPGAEWVKQKEYSIQAPPPYDDFLRITSHPQTSTAFITFNYDVGLDHAIQKAGRVPAYSFDGLTPPGQTPLLKLHGSLNWGSCRKCKRLHSVDLQLKATEPGDWHYRIGGQDFAKINCCPGGDVTGPMIVPPTWSKGEHHSKISKVWSAAAIHLRAARNIVVIGYSLPESDMFFRFLYALGTIGEHPLNRFIVLDPDKEVHARFEKLLGVGAKQRFKALTGSFADDGALVNIFNLTK